MTAYTYLAGAAPDTALPEPTVTPTPPGGWKLVQAVPTVRFDVPGQKQGVPDVQLFWESGGIGP